MVQLETVRSANATLVQKQPLVAVFSGGTSGIGEYTLKALATDHGESGKGLRIYLVGRNATAATRIFSECRETCPKGEYEFVQANDLSLIKDVDRCCDTIITMERERSGSDQARIDLLYMSHADLHFGVRRDTEEGLDKTMSFMHYSRVRFVVQLLPLLRASELPAHVVSVYAGGLEGGLKKLNRDDISLRKPENYGFLTARCHSVCMKTVYFEHLAKENPGQLSLTHVFPGLVITPTFYSSTNPWWFRLAWRILEPIAKWFSIPPEECGQRILYLSSSRYPARNNSSSLNNGGEDGSGVAASTDGDVGGGAYSVKEDGESNPINKFYEPLRREGFDAALVAHTNRVFEDITAGRVFKG